MQREQLKRVQEPEKAETARKQLADNLHKTTGTEEIILYGAGKNGQRLVRQLQNRGIEITAWCDSDSSKHGQ